MFINITHLETFFNAIKQKFWHYDDVMETMSAENIIDLITDEDGNILTDENNNIILI